MNEMVRSIDVPPDATVEQTDELLNRPYAEGFYLFGVVAWGRGARAFFKRRLEAKPRGNPGDPGDPGNPGDPGDPGNPGNRDGMDETARAIIQAHPAASVRELRALMAAHGFNRSIGWVSNMRGRLICRQQITA